MLLFDLLETAAEFLSIYIPQQKKKRKIFLNAKDTLDNVISDLRYAGSGLI